METEKSEREILINSKMKYSLKVMAVTAQIANYVTLMPKPMDFINKIVSDVILLSNDLLKLSQDMNRLLDNYDMLPTDFIETQISGLTGELTDIASRPATVVNNTYDDAETIYLNTKRIINTTRRAISDIKDGVYGVSQSLTDVSNNVSKSSSSILSRPKLAAALKKSAQKTLVWTSGKFTEVNQDGTISNDKETQEVISDIRKTSNYLDNVEAGSEKILGNFTEFRDNVNELTDQVNDTIRKPQKFLEELIGKLRKAIRKLSDSLDGGFQDVTGMSSISKGLGDVTSIIEETGDNSVAGKTVSVVSANVAKAISNFSIGKVVVAFSSILVQSAVLSLGLNQLPTIKVDEMLSKINGKLITKKSTYDALGKTAAVEEAQKAMIEAEINAKLRESLSKDIKHPDLLANVKVPDLKPLELKFIRDNISYSPNDTIKKTCKEMLQQQRLDIRHDLMSATKLKTPSPNEALKIRLNLPSSIKEVRKHKNNVKKAKQTKKLKDLVNKELTNFTNKANQKCKKIKSDWDMMMRRYKDSINQIKGFFISQFSSWEIGPGDERINKLAYKINDSAYTIYETCKGLKTQLIACNMKVSVTADITSVPNVPNPTYKIGSLWMDIKTIFKFLKDIITELIKILRYVRELSTLMVNGYNALDDIFRQLVGFLRLQWLIDLIQNLCDNFGAKLEDARSMIENMLSPVCYRDTEEYENTLDALEEMLTEDGTLDTTYTDNLKALADNKFNPITFQYKVVFDQFGMFDHYDKTHVELNEDGFEKILKQIEEKEDEIVAYKSPIIDDTDTVQNISVGELTNVKFTFSRTDIKFKGWHYYHPNLIHLGFGKKSRKNKIIQRAAKTYRKKRGGVNGLKVKHSWRVKKRSGYDAFHWYIQYTENPVDDNVILDASQDQIYVASTITTDNGSIVELEDGRKVFVADSKVISGDYVNVDGQRYKVK